jgi:predicted enzyme related to lactoylglutathione lyase
METRRGRARRVTFESPVQNRIGNVFIPVSDMRRARAWYGRLFGLELGEPTHDDGICDVPMAGETGIILDANAPVTKHSVQPLCFFWTHDLAAALDHLVSMEAEITSAVTDIGSVSYLTFRDPDGNPLMVCHAQ